MPLARANTARSSSRSPLPPSPRPPTFLPPSHYAEAGGLSPRTPTRNDSLTSSSDSHSQNQTPLESRRNSAFMPISSPSDSSFEFNFTPKPITNKRFSISRSGSNGSSKKSLLSRRSTRESHMTNLPLVEAQLLPTLRDTIDRMTRPQSRNQSSASPPPDNDADMGESSALQSGTPTPTTPGPHHSNSPPSPPAPSTPKPLRSALRVPTPKLQLPSPRLPAGPTNIPRVGPSTNPTSSSILKNTRSSTPTAPPRNRPRSRTDPGAAPQMLRPEITSPQSQSKVDPYPGSKGSPAASSIPRLRAAAGVGSLYSRPAPRVREKPGDDSASDVELRYELEARDRRSLRVVNTAGNVPSSESESDGEARARVGLGLGLDVPQTPRSFASKLRARFTYTRAAEEYAADEAVERRRQELLGLVQGLDSLGAEPEERGNDSGSDWDHGVVVSGSGRVDFGASVTQIETPRVMVSSSSGAVGEVARDPAYRERDDRRPPFWKRSRSLSPAPPSHTAQQQDRGNESKGRKSPSRSPVIRQTSRPDSHPDEERLNLMPEALKRHSVYHSSAPHRSPSPPSPPAPATRNSGRNEFATLSLSPESIYDEPEEQWDQIPDPEPSSPRPRHRHEPRIQHHSDDLANSDTVILALCSRLAAARQREALGIPPSASDAGYADNRMQGERMSYMDSGSSLARVGGMYWEEGDGRPSSRSGGGLSFGAEKLFRTLSGRTVDSGSERENWRRDPEYAFGPAEILKGCATGGDRPISLALSQRSSSSSLYDDDEAEVEVDRDEENLVGNEGELGDDEEVLDDPGPDSWRSTLSPDTYAAISHRYTPMEMQRQETIHVLYVTEESFVARLGQTIDLFILPLRKQNSKAYISGVPAEIAKLFDWLEDIFNLHTQLLSALRSVRLDQHTVVERVAETIRESFVKRLEVYQPYLAKLVAVAGTIARLVADNTSDFGEFVRIQESVRECRGWSLESLLVDPVTRLGRYPAMFRTLYEYTSKQHADYVPTFALLHSTDMVIKVMTEVKNREDEYDLVKSISQRIKGFPSSVQLAKRGRRLLLQGQLLRVRIDSESPGPLRTQTQVTDFMDDRPKLHTNGKVERSQRSSKFFDAIHEWDTRRTRSGSVKSNSSSGTTTSFRSYASAASSEPPLTPSDFSGFRTFMQRGPPSVKFTNTVQPSDPQLIQVFVFTDLVVITSVCRSRYEASEEWTLSENVGIVKVLGVTELSHETDSSPLLVLDVVPLHMRNFDESIATDGASLEVLYLGMPSSDASSSQEDLRKTWLAAFRQSLNLTLRSVAIPGGHLLASQGPSSIPQLATPQALPRSPSLISSIRHGESNNPQRQEREERGWWSSCFHQVLAEFQSRDVLVP